MHQWLASSRRFLLQKDRYRSSYILLLGILLWKYKKHVLPYFIALIITITAADQIASGICKPLFKRLRPCHQIGYNEKLHILDHHAGKYGFISSHASNSFAAAVFLGLAFGGGWKLVILLAWASLVSYSRIYVGVHFPLDIFFGSIVGMSCGWGIYSILKKVIFKYKLYEKP